MSFKAPFFPSGLSISGAVLVENRVLGILKKVSTGFLTQREEAHVTKDICQRFGAEENGGRAFITLQKVQTKSWALLAHVHKALVPEPTRLDIFPPTASFQVGARISQMTRGGMRKKEHRLL